MESRPIKNVYCLRLIYFCVCLVFVFRGEIARARTNSLFNVYRIHLGNGNLNAKVVYTFMKSAQVADCQPLLFGMCARHTSSWNHHSKINLYCVWLGGLGNFNDVRYIDNAWLCICSFVLKWRVRIEIIESHVRLIWIFLAFRFVQGDLNIDCIGSVVLGPDSRWLRRVSEFRARDWCQISRRCSIVSSYSWWRQHDIQIISFILEEHRSQHTSIASLRTQSSKFRNLHWKSSSHLLYVHLNKWEMEWKIRFKN